MFKTRFTALKSLAPRAPRRPRPLAGALLAVLAVLMLLVVQPAVAQEAGAIVGTVETHGERITLATARIPELRISAAVAADGTFRFDEVPAGTYLIVVAMPAFGPVHETVTVIGGTEVEVELEMRHGTHFDDIVVTASGQSRSASELAKPVSVLSGADLQLRLGATLGETLEGEPGVSSSSFGPGVGRPIIRGLAGARVRVLEGGVDSGDISAGSADHAVTFEPVHAKQIEILRGPATLRYGSEAIGGAVNVVDGRIPTERPVKALKGTIDLRGGSVAEERMGAVQLDGGRGEWAWHLGAVSRETDPYEIPGYARVEEEHDDHDHDEDHDDEDHDDEDHDDEDHDDEDHDDEDHDDEDHDDDHDEHGEEEENPFGMVPNTDVKTESGRFGFTRFFGNRGSIGVSVSGFDTDYGIPPGAHVHGDHEDDHDEDHDDEDHDDEDHDDEDHDDEDHDDEDHDDEDHDDDDHDEHGHDEHGHGDEELPIRLDMKQRRVDLRAEALPATGAFKRIEVRMAGTDYEHVELEGPDVGTTFLNEFFETRVELFQRERGRSRGSVGLQYTDRDFAAFGEEALVPPTQSQGWALFTSQEVEAGAVRWQFGARFEQLDHDPVSSLDTSHDGVSASAGLVWNAGSDWTLGVSVARSVRLPTSEELYSDGPHAATLSYDIGDPNLDAEVGAGFDVSLRRTEGRLTGELTIFRQSFSDFIYPAIAGEEGELAVLRYVQADATTEGAELRLRLELFDRNDHHVHLAAMADTVDAELDAGGNLPRTPPTSFGAGLHYHGHHWRAAVEGRWIDDQNDVAELEAPTEGYTMVNAHVGRRFVLGNQIIDLLLRGRNLTNEEARVHTSFLRNFAPVPGRDVTLSARFWF